MDMAIASETSVAELISVDEVLIDLEATTKRGTFEQVGVLMGQRHGMNPSQVANALFVRERLGSTGLGQGFALPHARIKGATKALGAFVRTRTPIPFDAPDGKPVSEMIVLLVPDKAIDLHLQLLANVAQ